MLYFIRKLRSSEHGLLLMNLCFALIGLYVTFIMAIHSNFDVGFCAFVGALLQYFFLVTFLIMGAEAINLYMKLVIVLGSNIHHFIWKVMIVCWSKYSNFSKLLHDTFPPIHLRSSSFAYCCTDIRS